MKNSLIIGWLIRLYAFLENSYNNSCFKKICQSITSFFKRITANSFFVNFFSSPTRKDFFAGSRIFGFVGKILGFFRRILWRAAQPMKRSLVFNSFSKFYSNLLAYPIRYYGVAAVMAVAVYCVYEIISGAMTNTMSVVSAIVLAVSAVLCTIEASAYNLFTNSVLVKLFGKLVDKCEFEERENLKTTAAGLIVSACAGVLVAVASIIVNPVYAVLFFGAIFAMGWVLYDFSVGIFIAAVILPFAPTMALVGLIMFTFASFVLRFIFDENMKFKHTALDIPLLFFAAILVVSAITSFAVKSSVMSVMVYLAFILSYFLITNSAQTKQRLFSLIVLMLFAGLAVAAYGIYQHIFGFADGATWIDEDMFSDIETRVVSTFENPNVLGEYLLLLIPVSLAVIWGAKKGYNKVIHLAVVCALALCMIYTYSRGCWIGLLVAVLMFFMFYDRRFVWLGVIALLLSPMFLPQNVINRFLSVGDMGDTSTSYRVYIWMGTLNMLKDYWLCGIGVGTEAFNRIYPLYSYSGVVAPHSHNLYLQIITENGIAGLAVFVAMMVVYYKECISTIIRCNDKLVKAIITGLAAGMIGYLVQGMFDNVWYNYRVFLLFFIIAGITVASVEIAKKAEVDK